MPYQRYTLLALPLLLGIFSLASALTFARGQAQALAPGVLYVAPGADCGGRSPCYAQVQPAIDAARPGDEIRLAAGEYTQTAVILGTRQIAYLTKTLTLGGGYALDNWAIPDPAAHPTHLNANSAARGVYITGGSHVTLQNLSLLYGNGDAGAGGTNWHEGGGVLIRFASADLLTVTVLGCYGTSGGGIAAINSALTIRSSQVLSNAADWGGALYAKPGNITIEGSRFSGNNGTHASGVIVEGGTARIANSAVTGNLRYSFSGGAAVYLFRMENATVTHSEISGNADFGLKASGRVFIASTLIASNTETGATLGGHITMVGCTVRGNHTIFGPGGIEIGASSDPNAEPVIARLYGNRVLDNTAQYGAGIYSNHPAVEMAGNLIQGNSASLNGGGLFANSGAITLTGDTIISNTAHSVGGGMHLSEPAAISLNSVLLAGNRADQGGSAIYGQPVTLTLAHVTIANNPGPAAIQIGENSSWVTTHRPIAIYNSLITGHTVGISVSQDITLTVYGMLWYSNTVNIISPRPVTLVADLTADPAFGPGYHLTPGSPAQDAGLYLGPVFDPAPWDFDGEPRPYQAPDLGADEYWPVSWIKAQVFLPVMGRNP